jgi:hypothetical protein
VKKIVLLCLLGIVLPAGAKTAPTVMLISIDGLKPQAVLKAQQHGLKLPNLVQLTVDGMNSSGGRDVDPSTDHDLMRFCSSSRLGRTGRVPHVRLSVRGPIMNFSNAFPITKRDFPAI